MEFNDNDAEPEEDYQRDDGDDPDAREGYVDVYGRRNIFNVIEDLDLDVRERDARMHEHICPVFNSDDEMCGTDKSDDDDANDLDVDDNDHPTEPERSERSERPERSQSTDEENDDDGEEVAGPSAKRKKSPKTVWVDTKPADKRKIPHLKRRTAVNIVQSHSGPVGLAKFVTSALNAFLLFFFPSR